MSNLFIEVNGGPPLRRKDIQGVLTKFLFDLDLKKVHLLCLTMHKHDVGGLALPDQLHDAFSVSMSTEGHVLNRHLDFHLKEVQTIADERKGYWNSLSKTLRVFLHIVCFITGMTRDI